jgi:muconolactone delta-isomerase
MKILAIERELWRTVGADCEPYLVAEAARAWELYQDGVIRELYFRADRHEAVLVLECADVEQARQALDTLPLVQNRLIDFELIPLQPYPGFARLFGR